MNITANTVASKLFVAFVAAAMVFTLATPAKAATVEELQAQVAALMAQLSALQGGSAAPAASSASCTFTRALTVGSEGSDVKCLQDYLTPTYFNNAGGSTGYFGPVTAAAVAAWQTANGVTPAVGYFGSVSQAKYNAMMAAAPAPSDDSSDDSSSDDSSDDSSSNGLGSDEGSIDTVTQISADESTLREGEASGLLAFEAEVTGDVMVDRVDVYMDVSGSGVSTRAANYFQGASLEVDGEKVASLDVSDFTEDTYNKVTNGSGKEYRLRFSGLDLVFADGDVPQFQVVMDANDVIDSTDQGATWALDLETTSIRTTDGKGFTDSVGTSLEVTFSMDALLVSELAITESDDSPESTTLEVSDTATTKDVTVAMFDVREKNGVGLTIDDMTFTATALSSTSAAANESTVIRTMSVWDGSTKLASKSVTDGGVVNFENMGLDIAADETVTLTIKMDFADSDAYDQGEQVTVAFTSVDSATDENGNAESDMTISGSVASAATHKLRTTGLSVTPGTFSTPTLQSDANESTKNYGNYVMNVEVMAFGDNFYIPLTTTRDASSTVGIAYQIEDSNGAVVSAGTSTGAALQRVSGGSTATAGYVKIADGSSATLQLSVPFDPAAAGTYRVQILTVGYALTAVAPTATETATPVSDFESANLYVTN